MHCRVFCSIPGLDLLDDSRMPPPQPMETTNNGLWVVRSHPGLRTAGRVNESNEVMKFRDLPRSPGKQGSEPGSEIRRQVS